MNDVVERKLLSNLNGQHKPLVFCNCKYVI